MSRGRIRIESDGITANTGKVFYVPLEGEEIEISNCVQGVDLHLQIGEPTTAVLRVILVEGHIAAEIEDVIVKRLTPRKKRPWRRLRDVTSMANDFRKMCWS